MKVMNDRLVWIDCEMTGLELRRDALIEIAALVTDSRAEHPRRGHRPRHPSPARGADAACPRSSREMHTTSGLLDRAAAGDRRWPTPSSRCSTTSASTCPTPARRRCAATPSPPTAASCPRHAGPRRRPALPHGRRLLDQGARPALVPPGLLRQPGEERRPPGAGGHHESIAELRYYREAVFVPHPGPDSETARAIAAKLGDRGPAGNRLQFLKPPLRGHGGCSSVGRAEDCGSSGRGFKSPHSPHATTVPGLGGRCLPFRAMLRPYRRPPEAG